jgi:hypothetical protein
MSSQSGFAFTFDTERERLHWTIEAGGGEHILDLIPGVLGSVAVEVDGRTVAHVAKPTPQDPWHETRIEIDSEPVDVALIWNRPVLHTDVFVGGRSVRDRRTLEQARAAAPRPATNYETWIGGLYRYRRPMWRPILSPWMAIIAVVSALALGVVLIWMARPSGLIAAAVVVVAMVVGFWVWFTTWTALTTRVHLALLKRPELGETRRLAWFTAALLGYPVLSVAVVVLVYGVARSLAAG